ncbi:hypothetical protein CQY20_24905 [Mycolicibacterium agri]|nr:hypothetical protein CQY20_24905 [Mycolicibacterium agri]
MIRPAAELSGRAPEGFTRAEGKTLVRLQNAELTRGLVTATRVQAAGMVATVGLQTAAMLSREAAFQADGDPAVSNRLNFIVDQYATFVGNEVARFGR